MDLMSSQTRKAIEVKTKEEMQHLVDSYDTWLFDCDGVIWHDMDLIDGVPEVLMYLRSIGKKIVYVTNNATKSRECFKAKFDQLGVEVHIDEIFGSAYASVAYLKYNLKFPKDKRVYVIGEEGIEEELRSEGIAYAGGTDPADNQLPSRDYDFCHDILADPTIGAVMCGFDYQINYKKIWKANRYLRDNKDCIFMITNDDSTFPSANGDLHPGGGSISAPLRYCCPDIKPIIVGKPNQPFMDCITRLHKIDKTRTIMIGDRLDTDILFGNKGGTASMMVLTGAGIAMAYGRTLLDPCTDYLVGVHKLQDFSAADAPIKPDFYVNSLGDLKILVG